MSKGKLIVTLAFNGPLDVRKENRDRAPWGTRTERVLAAEDITQEEANELVAKLRERNEGTKLVARWEGPVML